MQSRN
jgi:hypothetical protein